MNIDQQIEMLIIKIEKSIFYLKSSKDSAQYFEFFNSQYLSIQSIKYIDYKDSKEDQGFKKRKYYVALSQLLEEINKTIIFFDKDDNLKKGKTNSFFDFQKEFDSMLLPILERLKGYPCYNFIYELFNKKYDRILLEYKLEYDRFLLNEKYNFEVEINYSKEIKLFLPSNIILLNNSTIDKINKNLIPIIDYISNIMNNHQEIERLYNFISGRIEELEEPLRNCIKSKLLEKQNNYNSSVENILEKCNLNKSENFDFEKYITIQNIQINILNKFMVTYSNTNNQAETSNYAERLRSYLDKLSFNQLDLKMIEEIDKFIINNPIEEELAETFYSYMYTLLIVVLAFYNKELFDGFEINSSIEQYLSKDYRRRTFPEFFTVLSDTSKARIEKKYLEDIKKVSEQYPNLDVYRFVPILGKTFDASILINFLKEIDSISPLNFLKEKVSTNLFDFERFISTEIKNGQYSIVNHFPINGKAGDIIIFNDYYYLVIDCIVVRKIASVAKYTIKSSFSEGILPVYNKESQTWECLNNDKFESLPKSYEDIEDYHEGKAAVKVASGEWGYINTCYHEVIKCQYESVGIFNEGLAPVKKDGKYGYIDENNNVVIPFMYQEARTFCDGLAPVKKDDKFGYVDRNNNIIIPFKYDDAMSFSEGFGAVAIKVTIPFNDGNKQIPKQYLSYGFIDKNDNNVISYEPKFYKEFGHGKIYFFSMVSPFSDGISITNTLSFSGSKKGVMDESSKHISYNTMDSKERYGSPLYFLSQVEQFISGVAVADGNILIKLIKDNLKEIRIIKLNDFEYMTNIPSSYVIRGLGFISSSDLSLKAIYELYQAQRINKSLQLEKQF